ncbi:MAG: hypothetical protein IJW90_07585 [Clostridia bacterium]|nr:hypothetical protein [Clostridia bacterium]
MKNKTQSIKRCATRLISFGMALGMCITALLPIIPASAAEQRSLTENMLSAAEAMQTSEIAPSRLLAAITGETVSSAEGEWLDLDAKDILPAELSLSYDSSVPHSAVSVSFPSEDTAEITARVYTGEVCATVWTPVDVTAFGKNYPLVPDGTGAYRAEIPAAGEELSITVHYGSQLTVSPKNANLLMQAAYKRAEELKAQLDAYDQAVKDHAAATEAYNAYRVELQNYRAALAEYNAYQQALKNYQTRLAAYEKYLEDVKAYEERLALYEAYLSEKTAYEEALAVYTDFVNNPAAYEKKYLAYCAYVAELEKITAQLTLLDSCFISDEAGHVLNNTLNGPTVKTVVARQDELVSAGCDATDIANADQATKQLILLLKGYPVGGEAAKRYAYYIRHFSEIRDNVTLLYTSLSRLYGNDGVPDILEMQGKKERYWQFVAQLYALSCAMEDTVALNMQWSISGKKLTDLLDGCFILKDTNTAAPLAAYPAHMDEVVPPSQMKMPTPPAPVDKPVPPLKVTEPQKPETVSRPILPPTVPAPGRIPDRPLFSVYEQALAEAYAAHALHEREEISHEVSYPLALAVGKTVHTDDVPTAVFYDSDRMTLLGVQKADGEGMITWPQNPTAPEASDGMTYSFSGWVDAEGRTYTPEEGYIRITETQVFYAVYTATKASYTVTWDVEGTLTTETYEHGETPVYQGTPTKPGESGSDYTFVGWTPLIRPATQNVTYTAVFSEQKTFYEIQWVVGDDTEAETYPAGELPVYPSVPSLPTDGRYAYIFSHWSPEITEVAGNAVYTAVFEAVDLLAGDDRATLTETDDMISVTKQQAAGELFMSVSALLSYAKDRSCGLRLTQGAVTVTLHEDTVAAICDAQAESLRLCKGENGASLALYFYDASGKEISAETEARVSIALPDGQTGRITDASGEAISGVQDNAVVAVLRVGEGYRLDIGYAINVHMTAQGSDGETGGIYTLSGDIAAAGETVFLQIKASPGYDIKSVVVHDRFGGVIPHTVVSDGQYSFVMQDGNTDILVEMIPHYYTVTFCDGEHVISQERYRYGEMPVIPADPTRPDDHQYSYTFTGWSPTVTAVMGDTVYEAEFLAVPLTDEAAVSESEFGLLQLAVMGVLAAAVVCAGILIPYVIVQRRRGKTTHASSEKETEHND